MPATFTRYPIDADRQDTGMGGKPPVDRRPTGGGGGGDDNWERRASSRGGPHDLLMRYRRVLLYGLAGDAALFATIVGAYLVREARGEFATGQPHLAMLHALAIPPIVWVNTAVLVLSGVTMELARRSFFSEAEIMEEWLGLGRPALRRAMPWLAATFLLGGLFIAGQWMAWTQLTAQGGAGTPAGSHLFYMVTRILALHLLIGIVAMIGGVGSMFFIKRVMWRQVTMDCTAWYWYAISAIWMALFAVLLCAP